MNRLQRYANAIAVGILSVFPVFLVLCSVAGVCLGVALWVGSLVVPVDFNRQTFDNIGNFLVVLSFLISVMICIFLTRYMAKYLKYHTWEEITENSMLE